MEEITNVRKPFVVWEVNGVEYKLRLRAMDVSQLEDLFGRSLLSIIGEDDIPALGTMLAIVRRSMEKFQHGTTEEKVCAIYDDYVDEGGSLMNLYVDVVMPLFASSGFFTLSQTKTMLESMEKLRERM